MFNDKYKYPLFAFVLFFCLVHTALGQSLSVTSNNTSFAVGTSAQIESGTAITSSFSLNVNSGGKPYNLYAAITSKSFTPSTTAFSSVPVSITLRSITGVNTTGGATGSMQLNEYPAYNTLATNATKTTSNTAVWTYDIALAPLGYDIAPGTYAYTITAQYSDAQNTVNKTFNITIVVQAVVDLEYIQNAAPNLTFGTSAQYNNGITLNDLNSFTVKSNKAWNFSASAATPNFSNSGTYSTTMPASVLSLNVGSKSGTLSTNTLPLNTGVATAGTTFNSSLTAKPGYSYGPGIYAITINYTLTAQ